MKNTLCAKNKKSGLDEGNHFLVWRGVWRTAEDSAKEEASCVEQWGTEQNKD